MLGTWSDDCRTGGEGQNLHIPPRALPGQEVVTIKTEGCVLTLGPQRCYKYDF